MNPAACTKMHPSIPLSSSSAESRIPRHAAGSGLRFSNELGVSGMAWIRQLPLSSSYRAYLGSGLVPRSASSSNRCSFHGQ